MLLTFKRQFEKKVEGGHKTHTVRARRKIRPKVGEVCHCYVDARQKSMRNIGRFVCTAVGDVMIMLKRPAGVVDAVQVFPLLCIVIDGVALDDVEAEMFALSDGFDSLRSMTVFWQRENKLQPGKRWQGDLIHWKYKAGTACAPKRKKAA